MANKENTQVVVCSAADAPSPPLSQPQPSDEIVRDLAAFLPKGQDYVKIREDDQYYYVDIGRSKAVDQVYQSLYNRVDAIQNKYCGKLQALLTQLKAAQVTNTSAALHTTPSKIRACKRPVPKSSSINKVIISRSKRTTNATTSSISNDTTSSSSRGKSLFRDTSSKGQTTDDSINPAAIENKIGKLQSFAHLMTESIDPNTTAESASTSKSVATTITKSKKKTKKNMASSFKKPFIANEESVVEKGTVIQEESNTSLETGTAMKTRSRARQETLVNSDTKTITKADSGFSEVATSSSKSSRKGKAQVAASPKSLTKPNRGQLNKRRSQSASNLNPTPSKGKFVDLAPGLHKAVSLNKLNTASTASSSSSNSGPSRNVTPKRILSRRACAVSPTMISTPSSVATRRQEIQTSRQERLMMSTEKSKKAEEKKKALLDSRINVLKTKREKRMDKFTENKKAIDHEKEEKLKAIVDHSVPVGTLQPGPTSAMTKAEARNAERRLKLAQLQLKHDKANEAKKAAAAIATTSKATGAKALKATKSAKNQAKKGVGKKQTQPKPVQVEQEPTEAQPAENDVAALVMSPIAKLSGINGKINVTFTAGPGPSPFTTAKADVSVAVGNSTFICAPGPSSEPAGGDGTFSMASAPPTTTPNKTNSTFNLSKALQSKLNSTNNYEMTPPPRELTHNYDISQYIESDDEEKQAEHEAAKCGKPVPKWCQGKSFYNKVHAQFSMPPEQLAQWTQSLFPKPVLPVPLEDMGLTVREQYAQRSSSVNWKTVQKIESMLKQDEAELQEE